MARRAIWAVGLNLAMWAAALAAAPPSPAPVQDATLSQIPNVHRCGDLFTSGQPAEADLARLKEQGIRRLISLRLPEETNWDEAEAAQRVGLQFVRVPFQNPETLDDKVFETVRRLLNDGQTGTLLHCGSANRVAAVWLPHRVLDQGVPLEQALQEAREIGLRTPAYEEKARRYIARQRVNAADKRRKPEEASSVRPGINDQFLSPELDVREWLGRFEIESREVFAARRAVLEASEVQRGERVADVGAGTGFYSRLFADAVGSEGWVYAVDIALPFLGHIRDRAAAEGLTHLTPVLGSPQHVGLPPESVDLVFICDTYHHFEFPQSTLRSIYASLKPGGRLVVIDFERIEGKTEAWILEHVRAGKEVFRNEIEQAGFQFVGQKQVEGLKENYFLMFRKPPAAT